MKSAIEIIDEQVLGGSHVAIPISAWRDIVRQNMDLQNALDDAEHLLIQIRNQMCWERDRDQLTMGFCDLQDSVKKTIERIEKLRYWA